MLLPDDQPKADLHPDRLRALAILLGLPVPAAVEHSAILVLGVSLGSNLLALACEYPQASFTAMCMNQRELNQLQAACRHLGVHNIQLHLSEDIAAKYETGFDYILCHGYYSYLQAAEKEALLHHISLNLNENGIAYLDYLIEPGWQTFSTLQHLIANSSHFATQPSLEELHKGIHLIHAQLPEHSPLKSSLEHTVPNLSLRSHPDLNGYWPLQAAFADTAQSFIQGLHQVALGYVCDSDLSRYYFDHFSPALLQWCGNDFHKKENLYDLLHHQASRASLIVPIQQLIGFHLPKHALICEHMQSLHITGRFELDSAQNAWHCIDAPELTVVASSFNNVLVTAINQAYDADSTVSVSALLEALDHSFKQIPDIKLHATKLVADMVLSDMVHIRSQSQNGFSHRQQMLSLHHWRMQHSPYLTPANKWLQAWVEADLMALCEPSASKTTTGS
jgi:hypothetical protein